jgi:anti-sigma regulatory factor (Ser/Thr protein kinase)
VAVRPQQDAPDHERGPGRALLQDDRFEIRVSPGLDGPGEARGAITEWLGGRVGAKTLDDVRLVITELVTNSVRHGGLRPADHVRIRARATGDRLRVDVEDAGRAGSVERRRTGRGQAGGFGLNIVQTVSARWGVSLAHGTRVWAELALS